MIDLFNIPNSQENISIFYADGLSWQTWKKPRRCEYVWIMCIGGGGGGGSANVTGEGGSAAGGTGGASGAVTRVLFNSSQIPDILYIQVGTGGLGGTGSGNGSPGNKSWVGVLPNTTSTNIIVTSGTAAATNGTSDGNLSVGETAATTTVANFMSLGNFSSTAGVSGIGQQNVNPLTSEITTPGADGASSDSITIANGYSINSSSISPQIIGGIGSNTSPGGNGANGITSWKPFFSTGGAGGGNSVDDGTGNGLEGGNGGNGGIGSGGGGAGAGFANNYGKGGNGGDGLVIIISF
jgi:hypothetical protein